MQTISDSIPTDTAVPGGLSPLLAFAHFHFSCSSIPFIFLYWLWPCLHLSKQVMYIDIGKSKKQTKKPQKTNQTKNPIAATVVVYWALCTRHWSEHLINIIFHSSHNLYNSFYYPHFTDKEQKGREVNLQGHSTTKWQNLELNPVVTQLQLLSHISASHYCAFFRWWGEWSENLEPER